MTIRMLNRLDPPRIDSMPDGTHADGGWPLLSAATNGRLRSWIFRYSVGGPGPRNGNRQGGPGRRRPQGAGLWLKRDEMRALIGQGLDPLAERRNRQAEHAQQERPSARSPG